MKDVLPEPGETASPPKDPQVVPHTQVHYLLRRALENLEDVVATLLMLLLLVL